MMLDPTGGLLGGKKFHELDEAGYDVVRKDRLRALERLYEKARIWRNGLIDKVEGRNGLPGTLPAVCELAEAFDEAERLGANSE